MSERKVLNKYYPPDFDPSKIPKLKGAKANRQWSIRIMAPFNMRCNTCGEYIYKGKKFNSKKETVEDENYLGLHIFRFYIKCPRCVAEIAFKTDPESTDYKLEAGATRNFEAAKTAEEMAKKEAAAVEEEESNNPMKVLENRTKQSMQEMEMIETLEELKEMNTRHARVDFNTMIDKHKIYEEQLAKLQDEADDKFVSSLFGKDADMVVKRLQDDDDDDNAPPTKRLAKGSKPTDILTGTVKASTSKSLLSGLVKAKSSKAKSSLAGLVRPKATSSSQPQPPQVTTKPKVLDSDGFVRPSDPPAPSTTAAAANASSGSKTDPSSSDVTVNGSIDCTASPNMPAMNSESAAVLRTETDDSTADPGGKSSKTDNERESKESSLSSESTEAKPLLNALGLLGGAYSDSEEDSD